MSLLINRAVELLATTAAKRFGQFLRRARFGEELKASVPIA